jgi:hypothetical protein
MKKIFITSLIAILTLGFASPILADVPTNIEVLFQSEPMFNVGNFLPGDSETSWLKVKNNTADIKAIAIKADNVINADGLGTQINLVIKEGATEIYNKTFTQFFAESYIILSNLAGGGANTQYDFIATLPGGVGNDYQNKTMGFDLVVGVWNEEEQKVEIVTTGGGGGGGGSGYVCGDGMINQYYEQCDGRAGVTEGYTCTQMCQLQRTGGEILGENTEQPGETPPETEEPIRRPTTIVPGQPEAGGEVAGETEAGEIPNEIVLGAKDECPTCAWWYWLIIALLLIATNISYKFMEKREQ